LEKVAHTRPVVSFQPFTQGEDGGDAEDVMRHAG